MNCCVECEIDLAIAALEASGASVSPRGAYADTRNGLRGRQIGLSGLPVACLSNEVRPESGIHGHHGTTPDPDLRTTSRGFTYDLGQMLGEGWYDDETENA